MNRQSTDLTHLTRRALCFFGLTGIFALGGEAQPLTENSSDPAIEIGEPMRVDRGEGKLELLIPRDETLEFDVLLDIAVMGETKVGDFRLSAGVKNIGGGLPMPGRPVEGKKESGWIQSKAWGHYFGYSLDHEIKMSTMPQAWPSTIYTDHQTGSENRQRELKYGVLDGKPTSWYRANGHCKGCDREEHFVEGGWFSDDAHCKKCKRGEHRVWREPRSRAIPEGSLDMLKAIYLSREMIRLGKSSIEFSLIDKDRVWEVKMERGLSRTRKVPGGSFRCREVKLIPKPADKDSNSSRFEGLFGIHGTISIWLEEKTGVPVEIGGLVPLGPLDIDVRLGLTRWKGTPKEFRKKR
ncbi:MAG: hypothetical protein ACI841_003024 [Planctomycetota bacterium]|jgi:hypothetical protein